jgi:signal transduction histidine kinase
VPFDRDRLPGATGVVFVVPARTAQISEVQAYWRHRGATGLTLSPTPNPTPEGEHLFVVLDPVHQDFLERLYAGAQRMQVLIDDLLDYATADNRVLNTAAVDLDDLAHDVLRERLTGSGQPAVIVDPLPTVDGDPTLLRQVLDNLIGNALKYTRYGREPYVHLGCRPADGGWRIEVTDHGIGIPDDQRDSVFTAFTRAGGSEGYPGTGLGLAIVHRIIERHGGTVGVDANPGGGSRFWFTLPRTATRPTEDAVRREVLSSTSPAP